jgi:CDP-glycerol glycerophosphotransferase (TagB/SpsB family)
MLEIAEKYKDDVQFAFKPHPVLKFKLINIWGKEKTEAYYKKWEELENAQLEQGYYMDLFKTSDALIHDCASFTAEYLYTGKPVLFMVRDPQVLSHWNPFGRKCFDMHYHAENTEQIEEFIKNVVLQGQDSMQEEREKFCREYLYPADGVMPSQKIMNFLKEELKK